MTTASNPEPRASEEAMRYVATEHPHSRKAEPTGGPGHPFEGGTIGLTAEWDGRWEVRCIDGRGYLVPHNLTDHDRAKIDQLATELRKMVYRAQWRLAHPEPEPAEEDEYVDDPNEGLHGRGGIP